MIFKGKAWKFGDNVDTDVIIPVQYTTGTDIKEMAEHCMEGLDTQFPRKVHTGDIIVAGKNFGCGSSREPAPLAIKSSGISCIIAETFARIFYRNSFNTGLPILECEDTDLFKTGDTLTVDFNAGKITHRDTGNDYRTRPIPPFMQELIENGGLMNHIAKRATS